MSRAESDEAYLARYEVDRRTIYVGNLPLCLANPKLVVKRLIDPVAKTLNIHVIEKEPKNGSYFLHSITESSCQLTRELPGPGKKILFCFVELERPDLADKAVQKLVSPIRCGRSRGALFC